MKTHETHKIFSTPVTFEGLVVFTHDVTFKQGFTSNADVHLNGPPNMEVNTKVQYKGKELTGKWALVKALFGVLPK